MSDATLEAKARQLVSLHHQVADDLALMFAAFSTALGATRIAPSLAAPLLVGGILSGTLALRAFWLRWDLIDRLAQDRDAYSIAEVRRFGERSASQANRLLLASFARHLAGGEPGEIGEKLVRLAGCLEDGDMALMPDCAVACQHLLLGEGENGGGSFADDALVRLSHILAGFEPRTSAGARAAGSENPTAPSRETSE